METNINESPNARPDWPAIMREYESGNQSVAAYCQARGISKSRFWYWRSKLKAQAKSQTQSAFVPVRAPSAAVFRITLPNGLIVECQQLPEPSWLQSLLSGRS